MNWFQQEKMDARREGERTVLLRQLRRRFGELPASVVARIEQADLPDLETWADRFVTATKLDEVLDAA